MTSSPSASPFAFPLVAMVATLLASPLAAQAGTMVVSPAFVPNLGQWPDAAAYRCPLATATVFVTTDGWAASFADAEGGVALALRFVDAQPTEPVAEQPLEGVHHYFLGSEPAAWRTHVPRFGAVRHRGIYRGVDALAYQRGGVFEYDVELAPGTDLAAVTIEVQGADELRLEADGSMLLRAEARTLRQSAPKGFITDVDGRRVPITAEFELRGARRFGFRVPDWDGRRALVIDPGLTWSTFVGGTGADRFRAVAVDALGRTTVAGETASANFPVTLGAFDVSHNSNNDACVARLDPNRSGTAQLLWSTYLGGSDNEVAEDLVVDGSGVVTLTGGTASPNFPRTANARDTTLGGPFDAILVRFDPSASGAAQLGYGSFFGGSAYDFGRCLRIGGNGLVTISGGTQSSDLPVSTTAYDTTFNGFSDDYVARFDLSQPPPQQLLAATYLGGSDNDSGDGEIALDGNQRVVFAGQTASTDFPVTAGALSTSLNLGLPASDGDSFVAALDVTAAPAQPLVWSTFFGRTANEQARRIVVDDGGIVTIAGLASTSPTNQFLLTAGALVTNHAPSRQGTFLSRLDPTRVGAAQLRYSTLLTLVPDQIEDLALHADGSMTVV
ncbi:MAG: hypothetical protein IT457_01625 [Planctomycetes bacterium]|nr:hypothetical protein [Planctomycetota bacterium]